MQSALLLACKRKKIGGDSLAVPNSFAFSNPRVKTAPTGSLQIVAIREGVITLGVLTDGRVYATAGSSLAIARDEGDFERDPAWIAGLDHFDRHGGFEGDGLIFGGRFPEDAWVADTGRPYEDVRRIEHWQDGAWKVVEDDDKRLHRQYVAFGPWKSGRTLALRRFVARPRSGSDDSSEAAQKALLERAEPGFEVPGGKEVVGLPICAPGMGRRSSRHSPPAK